MVVLVLLKFLDTLATKTAFDSSVFVQERITLLSTESSRAGHILIDRTVTVQVFILRNSLIVCVPSMVWLILLKIVQLKSVV